MIFSYKLKTETYIIFAAKLTIPCRKRNRKKLNFSYATLEIQICNKILIFLFQFIYFMSVLFITLTNAVQMTLFLPFYSTQRKRSTQRFPILCPQLKNFLKLRDSSIELWIAFKIVSLTCGIQQMQRYTANSSSCELLSKLYLWRVEYSFIFTW